MSTTVEFDLSGIRATFEDTCRRVRVGAEEMAINLAEDGADYARGNHSYTDRTGDLTGSIQWRPVSASAGQITTEIIAGGSKAPYARIIEEGSKPHKIRGNPLVFTAKSGDLVFCREVDHPGTRPYGFMGQAYFKAERRIPLEFQRIVTDLQR